MSTTPAQRLLAAGIPLSLLCDLAATADPGSRMICATERPDGELDWLLGLPAAREDDDEDSRPRLLAAG